MNLTSEQMEIINYKDIYKKVMTIQAFAGTGKSTTMMKFMQENKDKKTLYLAFNTILATEMKEKMPDYSIMTIHAYALQCMKQILDYDVQCCGKIDDDILLEILNIDNDPINLKIIKENLSKFCNSSNITITDSNIQLLWDYYKSNKNAIIPHDIYLKMLQISKFKFPYDIIIVDEAQDINNCILSLIMEQKHCTRIFIGDIHQQIYGFRDVCNPFYMIDDYVHKRFSLTTTFRFGNHLANFSTKFLAYFKKEEKIINSLNSKNTQIHFNIQLQDLPSNTLITCRTNKTLFQMLYNCVMSLNKKICILGKDLNLKKEIDITKYFINIKNRQQIFEIDQSNIYKYSKNIDCNFSDLKEYFQQIDAKKWLQRINFFEQYSDSLLDFWIKLNDYLVPQHDADFILSTTHQAKGMEFDNVFLCNDFITFKYDENGKIRSQVFDHESYNIIYVAITRAKHNLYINTELKKWFDSF